MRSRFGWFLSTLAFGGLMLVFAGANSAQEKKHDKADLYHSLRDVINVGARVFNDQGDHAGCFRVYQGALLSVKPFLEPELQKKVEQGLAKAEGLPNFAERAFELRRVIDEVRARARPEGTGKKEEKKEEKKDEKKEVKKEKKTTLWERMGGDKGVTKIVLDAATFIEDDKRIDLSRGGKFAMDAKGKAKLVRHIVEYVSSITGGPLKYDGKNMREAHRGMAITDAEYSAATEDVKKAMEKNKVAPADVAAVMQKLEGVRKQVVEPKKKEEKKEEKQEKKEEEKKVDEKKKEEKKAGEEKKVEAPAGDKGQVEGRVTYGGKALPAGYMVTLVSEQGRKFSTTVQKNGAFDFKTPLPPGNYRVAVAPFGEAAKGAPELPPRYRAEATSGLTVSVQRGRQMLELNLVP